MAWLLTATPYDSALGAERRVVFSDVGFTSEPTDAIANTHWKRQLEVPLVITESLYAGTSAGGASSLSVGNIELANLDGSLDYLDAYEWDGRVVEVRYSALEKPKLADFALAFNGTAARLVPGTTVRIEVRDLQVILDVPVQANLFAGTGAAEGPAARKDSRKPKTAGVVRGIEPISTDSATGLYLYHDGPAGGVFEVEDRGVLLTPAGPDYPTVAAMVAAFQAGSLAGYAYATCDAAGAFVLTRTPAGPVTVSCCGGTRGANVVADPTFANGAASWSAGAGWMLAPPRAAHAMGTAGNLVQVLNLQVGKFYSARIFATATMGTATATIGTASVALNPTGRASMRFRATSATMPLTIAATAMFAGSVEGIDVREVPVSFADLAAVLIPAAIGAAAAPTFAPGTVDALNLLAPFTLGEWLPGDETGLIEVLDTLATSVGGYYGFNELRQFVLGRLDTPAAVPDYTFTDRYLDLLEPVAPELRLKEQILGVRRRWRPLADQDMATDTNLIPTARRDMLKTEWRTVKTPAEISGPIGVASLLARSERLDTCLDREEDGLAEATRRVSGLYGPKRLAFNVTVPLGRCPGLRKGMTVRLVSSRYRLQDGRNFRVMQLERDGGAQQARFQAWG